MNRATSGFLWALIVTLAACNGGEKERAKLAEVQRQADEQVARVEADAKEKLAAMEKKVELLQADVADAGAQARAAAEEEVASARGDADKFASQAAAALGKARAAYKESEKNQLAALGKEADELKAKAAKATSPKTKPQVDVALKNVTSKRDVARKEIEGFDAATLDTIKSVKLKVDKALADLKHAVQSLRAKIPNVTPS